MCDAGGWCDYVFAPDYPLPSLTEIDEFIGANQHLPDFPSAASLEEDGQLDLGRITVLQQLKIEELYLYLLQQEARLKEVERQLTVFQQHK